jgi:hypothetical protein
MSTSDDYKTGFDEGVRYAKGTGTYAQYLRYERFNADPDFDFMGLELPGDEQAALQEHLDRGDTVNVEVYKKGWLYGVLSIWKNVRFKGPKLW